MAIATFAAYKDKLENPYQVVSYIKKAWTAQSRPMSLWTRNPTPGVAPTTAVVPTNTTVGCAGQFDSTTSVMRLLGARIFMQSDAIFFLCDRLGHQAGLDGTSIAAQTTNLPTAALTRYTNGIGVIAALEIYTAVGATTTTAKISYTNQAGTTGQISPLVSFGGSSFSEANRSIWLPYGGSDTGLKAVASVTLTASTLTAGNFGVTLFKVLAVIEGLSDFKVKHDALLTMACQMPEIVDGACLYWQVMSGTAAPAPIDLILAEE